MVNCIKIILHLLNPKMSNFEDNLMWKFKVEKEEQELNENEKSC